MNRLNQLFGPLLRILFWLPILLFVAALILVPHVWQPEVSHLPAPEEVETPVQGPPNFPLGSYDVMGHLVPPEEANRILATPDGKESLHPSQGAIRIDEELLRMGRKTFYTETFGNEYFLTDIMGILNGPMNLYNLGKALLELRGRGTDNLEITIPEDIQIGNRFFRRGEKVKTGLDVAPGTLIPVGMVAKWTATGIKVGVTCALCHTALNPDTGRLVEGAPNRDLNIGLMMAMATNSSVYFRHTGNNPLDKNIERGDISVPTENGSVWLPDADTFEQLVDSDLLSWPPGNFDSSWDLVNNPTSIPDTYTFAEPPYGWSGFAAVGPFAGLSSFNNNVHAGNTDTFSTIENAGPILGIPNEVYLGTLLQNAPEPWRLPRGVDPAVWFQKHDPTPGVAGINQLNPLPSYPHSSLVSPDGLLTGSPGTRAGQQNNAMSAWQHQLRAPAYPGVEKRPLLEKGEKVFQASGCADCHNGPAYGGGIMAADRVGTEPTRARAFRRLPQWFGSARIWAPDEPLPLREEVRSLPVPLDSIAPHWLRWPFSQDHTAGAYKIPGLIGQAYSAPYLHDGGVAVGVGAIEWIPSGGYRLVNVERIGMAGLKQTRVSVDPEASLLALIDRDLRRQVVAANQNSVDMRRSHVTGQGHEFWVDPAAGYTRQEQRALIDFLLSLSGYETDE